MRSPHWTAMPYSLTLLYSWITPNTTWFCKRYAPYLTKCASLLSYRSRTKLLYSAGGLVTKPCPTLETPWTAACQAPLAMGFCRQEHWSGLPFLSPGNLTNPEIEPGFPALQADSLPTELQGKPRYNVIQCYIYNLIQCSVQFSRSVQSDSLWSHESQHARPPCPSPTPRVHSNPCPSSRWCHPAISSSVVPFSSCPQSLPASGSFPMSQLFTWGDQSIGVSASASVLPMNTHDWSPIQC